MVKRVKYLSVNLLALVVVVLLAIPVPAGASPLGNHIKVNLEVAPVAPVAGQETRLTISLVDSRQQSGATVPVSVVVDKVTAASSGGHAGMHGGASAPVEAPRVTASAKATEVKGEYVAVFKLPEEGPWRIMVTAGDTTAHQDVNASKASGATGSQGATVQRSGGIAAPMEAVHASYLDLSTNISDLRTRINEWEKGSDDSRKIAEEKLERIQAILGSLSWPPEMSEAVGKAKASVGPMGRAITGKNVTAAQAAAKTMGDASHDVTHAFYPEWVPALEGLSFGIMAPHAIYLDIAANITDLETRVLAWQKGDESSLNIAKEKAERLGVLLPHMYSTGVLLRPLQAIEKSLPAVVAALEQKDAVAAQRAMRPVADLLPYASRDIYSWMNVTGGANNPACVQASYLDLASSIPALRSGIGDWEKGNLAGLDDMQDRLERVGVTLAHPAWPAALAIPVQKAEQAIERMAISVGVRDLSSAQASSQALGDASHDLTHAYYVDWLPAAGLDTSGERTSGPQGSGRASGGAQGHASESGLPNYWFVGSLLGIVGATIVLVPILRRRETLVQRAEED